MTKQYHIWVTSVKRLERNQEKGRVSLLLQSTQHILLLKYKKLQITISPLADVSLLKISNIVLTKLQNKHWQLIIFVSMLFSIGHVLFSQGRGVAIMKYLSLIRVVDLLGDFHWGGVAYLAILSFMVQI